jgi:hypothetical protein
VDPKNKVVPIRRDGEMHSCPEHNEPMMFPTSITLPGGDVIEKLYYCVERCEWRYSTDFGYKKATDF